MTIQRSIVVSLFAVALVGCGSKAGDTGSAGTTPSSSSTPVSSTNSGAVPPTLRSTIASTLKVDEGRVIPAATFAKDLGADDLSMVELVMAYERTFKVDIPNADADRFKTVQDVVDYLGKRNALK